MNKELIIDKNTNLNKIDFESYSKLILKSKISTNKFKKFINVKELRIVGSEKNDYNDNEYNINKLPFVSSIEKLTFVNILYLGKKGLSRKWYTLNTNNLKSIEIPTDLTKINDSYISNCNKLEEIIFNVTKSINFDYLIVDSNNIKKIYIKYLDKEYILNVDDYIIDGINSIKVDDSQKTIEIRCRNKIYTTYFLIDTINNTINKQTILDGGIYKLLKDDIINIPDFVNNITCCIYQVTAKELSLNVKLLENANQKYNLFYNSDLEHLEKIIVRKNNEMSLFPNEVFDTRLYGNVKELYTENQELHIVYENFEFIIDKNGKSKKREFLMKELENEINFNKYSLTELEEYLCYKKLLLLIKDNDKEFKDAMNIIEGRILKRLMKK